MEILRHAIGPAVGRLVLTAALLNAPQARSVGLVDDVEVPDALLDSVIRQAQTMTQVPSDVFAVTKRQLQQPARDRIAARSGDAETVLAMWSSARTRDAIAAYLSTLRQRPR